MVIILFIFYYYLFVLVYALLVPLNYYTICLKKKICSLKYVMINDET